MDSRNRIWPVLLVALVAALCAAVLLASDAHDLDPRVWQAIVAGADFDTP